MAHVTLSSPLVETEKCVEHHVVASDETTHVTLSSPLVGVPDVTLSSPLVGVPDVTLSSPLVGVPDVTLSSPLVETEKCVEHHVVASDETTHVTLSSPHKYFSIHLCDPIQAVEAGPKPGLPVTENLSAAVPIEAKPEPEGLALRGRDDAKAEAEPASVTVAVGSMPSKEGGKAQGNVSPEGREILQAVAEPEWKPTRRQILPPPKVTLIGGLPVQVAHWVSLGVYSAEANLGRGSSLEAELAKQASEFGRRMGRDWSGDVAAAAQAKLAARIRALADDPAPATVPALADLARQYQPQP